MNLRGKSYEQVKAAVAHKSRRELVDLIYSLVTVEQLLKPAEIAARSCRISELPLRDIRDGKFTIISSALKTRSRFRQRRQRMANRFRSD
jgi:hypothetical protein